MTGRPHLWVPDGDAAEICTLCGEWLTPATAEAECPEAVADELASVPAEEATRELEAADSADDELRQGIETPPP